MTKIDMSVHARRLSMVVAAAEESLAAGGTPFVSFMFDNDGNMHVGSSTVASLEGAEPHSERLTIQAAKGAGVEGAVGDTTVMYAFARPCNSCAAHAFREGVTQIVYAVDADDLKDVGLSGYPAELLDGLLHFGNHPALRTHSVLEAWRKRIVKP